MRVGLVVAAVIALTSGCASGDNGSAVTLRFWAFGHEGEVVQAMMPDFERTHPGIHVRVEQIPFTAAHEKLLTAVVGRASPDIAQLGNTWLPELATLHAVVPLDSLIAGTPTIDRSDYFPGVWNTNVLADTTFGVPWYVDTRVLFYRSDVLAKAGYQSLPTTWSGWFAAMRAIRAASGDRHYAIYLPVNEWAQPVILAMAAGSSLLRDRDQFGDFTDPRFRAAWSLYVQLFADSLAPAVSNVQVANLYTSFARGDFSMFISGPWDVGECLRRMPDSLRGRWSTAPMPVPDAVPGIPATAMLTGTDTAAPGASLAGGSSLVLFRGSPHVREAWALIEYLSAPAQQATFYRLAEDLPPRMSVWRDPALADDPYMRAFATQLRHVRATPQVPEWDQITTVIADHGEAVARGAMTTAASLASLDRDVGRLLAKRRSVLAHEHSPAAMGQ